MALHNLNQDQFTEVTQNGVCLIDVYGSTCGPCAQLAQVLEQLVAEMPEAEVYKLCAEENMAFIRKNRIMGVPTLYFYKNGERVKTMVGLQDLNVLKAVFKELLAS